MSQEKTPTKRKSHGRVPQAYGTIDPDFSNKVLKFNMEVMKIRDDKPKTIQEMEDTISSYFQLCAKYKLNPTVERSCTCYSLLQKLTFRNRGRYVQD